MKSARSTHTHSLPRTIRRWRVALGRMAWWKFLLLLFALTLAAKLVVGFAFSLTGELDETDLPDRAAKIGWVFAVVIAPLLETLAAQAAIVGIVRLIVRRSFITPVVVSGLLFGCLHWISPVYVVLTAGIGLIWAFAYLSRLEGRGFVSAFLLLALVHMLNNSLAYIV